MTFELSGTKQLSRSTITAASVPQVWSVLIDARRLPEWASAVNQVVQCDERESVGSVRHCDVELSGKPGRMVERCVHVAPNERIAYVVDDDSFGMSRMFDDYGFSVALTPDGAGTRISIDTHYTPRNPLYAVMNAVMMRRQLTRVVDALLAGLASAAERSS